MGFGGDGSVGEGEGELNNPEIYLSPTLQPHTFTAQLSPSSRGWFDIMSTSPPSLR